MRSVATQQTATIPLFVDHSHHSVPWLVNCAYGDSTWWIRDVGSRKPAKVSFDVALTSDVLLLSNQDAVADIKRVTWELRSGRNPRYDSGNALASVARNLITLRRWAAVQGIFSMRSLTADHLMDFAEVAIYGLAHILDAPLRVTTLINDFYALLGSNTDCSRAQRYLRAAEKGVPLRVSRTNGERCLERESLLRKIGLDGMGIAVSREVAFLLDEFERYLNLRKVRARRGAMPDEPVAVTPQTFGRYLAAFSYLFSLRRHLHDPLTFDPAVVLPQAHALANRRLSEVRRTQTIPPAQAFACIGEAVRYIEVLGDPLHRLERAVRTAYLAGAHARVKQQLRRFLKCHADALNIPATADVHAGTWRPRLAPAALLESEEATARRLASAFYLDDELTKLQTACAIVIAAYSARRLSEILSLRAGCISRDASGRPFLAVFVHKTVQAERSIPVPQLVAQAVALLEKLSAEARARTHTNYLFIRLRVNTGNVLGLTHDGFPRLRLGTHMKVFGYSPRVPSLESGERWAFRPHQFRKLFAMLFVYAYRGSVSTLSAFLFHFDIEMTKRYLEDPDNHSFLLYADKHHSAHVIARAALGQVRLQIEGPEEIRRELAKLMSAAVSAVKVVSVGALASRLESAIEHFRITVRATAFGYCVSQGSILQDVRNPSDASLSFIGAPPPALPEALNQLHTSVARDPHLPAILRQASQTVLGRA